MQSLFLKIFLWFWLTIALVAATFFSIGFNIRPIQQNPIRQDFAYKSLSYYSQTAIDIKNRDGDTAFHSFLDQLEKSISVQSYVLDNQNQQIYGGLLPAMAKSLSQRARFDGEETRGEEGLNFISLHKVDAKGTQYNFIWQVKFGPPPFGFVRNPANHQFQQVMRIIAVIIATFLLCYLLSRYLTKPIVQLTDATRQLANGNLTARVGSNVANRRDEVAELARNFNIMAERISYLLESQKRLLRDISHELRSPLARLNVALSLARKRAGKDATSNLDRIELESERLNELIEQLLTLTRLDGGKENIKFEAINLEHLVEDLVADADFEAQSMERAVKIVTAEQCQCNGNESLLRRAIENVLRNAIRYTAVNTSVDVYLNNRTIRGNSYAVISICDHGEGVPENSLTELFNPFYRVSDSRERGSGGSGLGLAIVEQAVKLHNGQVKADNITGGGLKVDIHLPLSFANVD